MAELKRHMDVLERVSESFSQSRRRTEEWSLGLHERKDNDRHFHTMYEQYRLITGSGRSW